MNTVRIYALAHERKSPRFFLETDDLLDLTLVTLVFKRRGTQSSIFVPLVDLELGVHRIFLTISNNYKYFLERKSVFLSLIDERLVSIMSTIKAIYGDRVSKEYNAY